MITTNKKYYILLTIYAIYSVCNFQTANCESLSDVSASTLTKMDKSLGWLFIIGTTLFCGYLFYKGIYPTDSTGTTFNGIIPIIPKEDIQAPDVKTPIEEETKTMTTLKDSEYLKFLQEITKYNN